MTVWTSRMVTPGRYTLKRDGVELIEISTTGCDHLPGLVRTVAAAVAGFYGDEHDDPYTSSAPEPTHHLTPLRSDRGFTHLPELTLASTGRVRVYESSAASVPHIWLEVARPRPLTDVMHAHMNVDEARHLAEQLLHLCEHHYQLEERSRA